MMRRVNLLPTTYVERRRQQRRVGSVLVVGLLILLLLVGWWFLLSQQIGDKESELADVQARNAQIQAEIDKLQRFAALEREVQTKVGALATVMAGDVDWPSVLTEIAMVVPGEIWLTDLTASAGATEGATPVGTETAPIRVSQNQPIGRIQFTGRSLTMPGVAKWMIRLESVREFASVWLNSATEQEEGTGVEVIEFENTLELSRRAIANRRFGEDLP